MKVIMFDTLKLSRELRGPFSPEQADSLAQAIAAAAVDTVATKSDLTDLKAAVKSDMADLRVELKSEMASLRTEMASQKVELVRWMVAQTFVIVGLVVGPIKIIH